MVITLYTTLFFIYNFFSSCFSIMAMIDCPISVLQSEIDLPSVVSVGIFTVS